MHVYCLVYKFACGRGSVDEQRPGRRVVSMTDAMIAAVDSLVWSDWHVVGIRINV